MDKKHLFTSMRETDLVLDKELRARSSRFTAGRTVCFVALVFAFAAGYDGAVWGVPVGALLTLLFILLVRRHEALRRRQLLLHSHIAVVSDMLTRFSDKWQALVDTGAEFRREKFPQEVDLHIFGEASLYQYLSQARTRLGRERLARALSPVPPAVERIRSRQTAVRELLDHPLLCTELAARARLLPFSHDVEAVLTQLEQPAPPHAQLILRTGWLLPTVTFISLVLAGLGRVGWAVPGLLLTLQLALTVIYLPTHLRLLAPLGSLAHDFSQYTALFTRLEEIDFASSTLKALQSRLREGQAARRLRELTALTTRVGFMRNAFFLIIVGTGLLWGFRCARDFYRWRERAADSMREWLGVWAEVEVLLSLATVGHTRERFTFPEIIAPNGENLTADKASDDKVTSNDGAHSDSLDAPVIRARELTSLLLTESAGVANDVDLSAGTAIITGSNMSGKTTYMRTLATSAVLAYAGAPVCAREMALSPLYIYTSIQVNDDLAHGISTFYAELLRIKQMVEFSQTKTPMLICIDEIFKGTNSADRIVGARETISRLTLPHAITIVTTHDFELCELQSLSELPVTNYHFEEYYEDDKIKFDYQIKPDRCHTTNAQYLLKMAGIIK